MVPAQEFKMVSNMDVTMAYRLLMGREPENQQIVQDQAQNFKSLADLRAQFMTSSEFREIIKLPIHLGNLGSKPLDWPPAEVEVSVSPAVLQRMVTRIEGEFLEMGATEPHWSVLTADRFLASNIKEHQSEFFASGEESLHDLQAAAARCHLDLSRYRDCLELGCGLGRVTLWLARNFREVVGADISRNHLDIARGAAAEAGLKNINFLNINQISQYQSLPAFDLFFSVIVLQHNPPPLMAFILETILRRLAPGGAAYFQIPTHLTNYHFSAKEYFDTPPMVGNAEVHCIPQPTLFDIIRRTGCEILEIREMVRWGTTPSPTGCCCARTRDCGDG
jgi:SAM-dependent methyltransferase